MAISTWVLLFFLYSSLGWLCEVIFVSVGQRRLVNRGFLYGPLCPIYGFGALMMILLQEWVPHPLPLFLLSMVLLSALEYVTSVLLERLFHLRLWDYSKRRFQLHGRVCLRNSVLFGLLCLAVCYGIQPVVMQAFQHFSLRSQRTLVSVLLMLAGADLAATLHSLHGTREKIAQIKAAVAHHLPSEADLRAKQEEINKRVAAMRAEGGQEWEALMERLRGRSGALRRILNAYPQMHERTEEISGSLRKLLPVARASHDVLILNDARVAPRIRYNEKGQPLFGQSASFARYFAVFFIGCVLGYFGEEIFCLIQNGHLESRQGLLYGPISQVYGMGLVIMVAFLDAIPTRNNIVVFLACAVLGGAFEFFCSYFQERIFGTVSWDYTDTLLSIDGRTNLMFMIIWGVAGVFAMRYVMPWLTWLIESIPPRAGKRITFVLAALILIDVALTIPAVYCYTARQAGKPISSAIGRFFGRHYPDRYMRTVFPNMKF